MRVSDELKRGKANLQRWGWTQGLIRLDNGNVCAIGALMFELDHELFMNGSKPVNTGLISAQHRAAVEYLERAVPADRQYLPLWGYNDHHGNQERIEDLYDRAIALAEADEAKAAVQAMIAHAEAYANMPVESFDAETQKGVDSLVGAC